MRAFVTGATGMLGSRLAERLVADGHEVTVLVRSTSDRSVFDGLPVTLSEGALPDETERLAQTLRSQEWVFHCAAMVDDWADREEMYRTNVSGLASLIAATDRRALRRFVYVSSMAVLGMSPQIDLDENAPVVSTGDNYNFTKIEAEKLALRHAEEGLPITIVRPPYIYGPRDRQFFPRVVDALRDGTFKYIGGGGAALSLVYVENLVDAMMLAAKNERTTGEVFMITDGEPITRRELIETIAAGLGLPKPSKSVPLWVAKAACPLFELVAKLKGGRKPPLLNRFRLKFMATPLTFNIAKARRVLGYEPRFSTPEGLARTIAWHKKQREAPQPSP
ncbi:MAG: NAD-dependent epimerase/dehydratase family protein [Planctomycetota bacterium]